MFLRLQFLNMQKNNENFLRNYCDSSDINYQIKTGFQYIYSHLLIASQDDRKFGIVQAPTA